MAAACAALGPGSSRGGDACPGHLPPAPRAALRTAPALRVPGSITQCARGEREDCGLGCSRSSPGDWPRGVSPSLPSEALLPQGPSSGNWGARPFLRTCPHLALSFALPYLGLSLRTSTKMRILEEESLTLKERPGGREQRTRLLRARRSRCSNAPWFPASLGVRGEGTAHTLALLCPANQPHHFRVLPALLA